MDANDSRLTLKKMLAYLAEHHGIKYTVATIHQLRTRGEGPPAHKRRHRLEYVPAELDTWVAGLDQRDAARENKRAGRSPLSLDAIAVKLCRTARAALAGESIAPAGQGFVHCSVSLPPALVKGLRRMGPPPPPTGRARGRWEKWDGIRPQDPLAVFPTRRRR